MLSRFLLVEDEPTLQRVISSVLGDAGHVVETASTVAQALARLHDRGEPDIDLILADKNLPDGTGLDVLAAVRASSLSSRFVMVTGYPNPDSAQAVLALGAEGYWSKPLRSLAVAMRQLEQLNRQPTAERRRGHRMAHAVADALRNQTRCEHSCAPWTETAAPWLTALHVVPTADAHVIVCDGWPDDNGWAALTHKSVVVVSAVTPMDALVRAIDHGAVAWLPSC